MIAIFLKTTYCFALVNIHVFPILQFINISDGILFMVVHSQAIRFWSLEFGYKYVLLVVVIILFSFFLFIMSLKSDNLSPQRNLKWATRRDPFVEEEPLPFRITWVLGLFVLSIILNVFCQCAVLFCFLPSIGFSTCCVSIAFCWCLVKWQLVI